VPDSSEAAHATRPSSSRAWLVGAGILLSRLAGLVRLRVFAHYFGLRSDAADAFNAAFRIPNLLQNLFGEGALSGSFIPVYASLVARGDREVAGRVARAVAALLACLVAVLVAIGVASSPWLVAAIAPGFTGEKRTLTVALVRVLFPGAGLLVLSAWCLGVLNSHQRFLLPYAAPVGWNAAMIATLLIWGGRTDTDELAVALAWGSVAGSALQLLVQLPAVVRVVSLRGLWDRTSTHVREIVGNFGPVLLSRGVVQISAYIDTFIASWLPTGAVTGLANAQLLYTLPVSLFGMSIAASELPAMAGAAVTAPGAQEAVRQRLERATRQVTFLVIPSTVAFLLLGDTMAAALLQTGRFTARDADLVWGILAGSAVGLLASTLGRLYASTFFALRDTRSPFRFAVVRVTLTSVLGYLCAIPLPRLLGVPALAGAAGLALAGAAGAWVEQWLLRRSLHRRIGASRMDGTSLRRIWAAAVGAGLVAFALKIGLHAWHPIVAAALVLGSFGAGYLGLAAALSVPEAQAWVRRALFR